MQFIRNRTGALLAGGVTASIFESLAFAFCRSVGLTAASPDLALGKLLYSRSGRLETVGRLWLSGFSVRMLCGALFALFYFGSAFRYFESDTPKTALGLAFVFWFFQNIAIGTVMSAGYAAAYWQEVGGPFGVLMPPSTFYVSLITALISGVIVSLGSTRIARK